VDSPPASKAVAAVRSAVVSLNSGDVDGYVAHFDPECPRWVPGVATPLTLTDIADNFKLLAQAFDELYLHETNLFGDDRYACARWRLTGIHVGDYLGFAPHHKPIEVDTCEVYELAGDRVVASWVYGDLNQLFQQISPDQSGEQ
jgi:limonene-1,2-epoxide hydrolase